VTAPEWMPARAVFLTERVQAQWTERYAAYLLARMSREELFRAWDDACCGMKTEGRRARKAELAGDLARHDAYHLGESWPEDAYMRREVDAAESRVRAVGVPTYWAGAVVTGDDDCPLDEHGWHVWSGKVAVCFRCGTDMSAAVLA
jgi:hypothetical protein